MRYIKLTSSLLIGFVGFVFYFFTLPSLDTENFLTIETEAEDENILEDVYLDGSLDYNNTYYSSFTYQTKDKETLIQEELPFLQKIDDPNDPEIRELLKQYPEFISDFNYDTNRMTTQYGVSEEYVAAASFNYESGDYTQNLEEIQFELFNKETEEIQKEKIKRTEDSNASAAELYAIYEDYPNVNILFSTNEWDQEDYTSTSTLNLVQYNLETKKYSENVVKKVMGDFMFNEDGVDVSNNKELALIPYYREGDRDTSQEEMATENISDDDGQDKVLQVNLVTGESEELPISAEYLLSDENKLFSFAEENGEAVLNKYGEDNKEVTDTIPLALETIELSTNAELIRSLSIIDDYLLVIQSELNYEETDELTPAIFQAFALDSGEEISKGKFVFENKNANISQAFIGYAGKNK